MQRTLWSFATIALVGGLVSTLSAQGPGSGLVEVRSGELRHGFFITGALGDGMEQYAYSDSGGYSNTFANPAFALRFGGTPSPSFRLGVEFFGWSGDVIDPLAFSGTDTETFGTFLLTGQFYPSLRAGLYVKGGLGVARSATECDNCITSSETGFGWSVGAGWDVAMSRSISIGPVVDFYQGAFTARDATGASLPTITEHVLNIGASITFQSNGRWR